MTKIRFVVFWKQKKQESIEITAFVVFWNQKKQENIEKKEFGVLEAEEARKH